MRSAALAAATLVMAAISFWLLPAPLAIFGALFAATVVWITAEDYSQQIIPDAANLAAVVFGLGNAVVNEDGLHGLVASVERGAAMFFAFYAVRLGYRALRGNDGMGLGDVKLAAAAGVWLDWANLPIAVEIACAGALMYILLRRAFWGQKMNALNRLPFGAFFAPAIWLAWIAAPGSA